MNITVMLFSMAIIGASSLLVELVIMNTSTSAESECEEIPTSLPVPQLHNQYNTCANKGGEEYTITYNFNAEELEDSVDFYSNRFTPIDWLVLNNTKNELWNTLQVKKGNIHYNIKYKFQIHNSQTPSIAKLKQLKLLHALQGKTGTKLIWKARKAQTSN
jgi:hypothetical protein